MEVLLPAPNAMMVKLARASLNATAVDCGKMVGVDSWWWDAWESGAMQMPPQFWTLFCICNSYHPVYATVKRCAYPDAPLDDTSKLVPDGSFLVDREADLKPSKTVLDSDG